MSAVAEPPSVAKQMTDGEQVSAWLESFEDALTNSDSGALAALFQTDSHWRDLVAFTWHIRTSSGAQSLSDDLIRFQRTARTHKYQLDESRSAPQRVKRLGVEVIEGLFEFQTIAGRGSGVIRLTIDEGPFGHFQGVDTSHDITRALRARRTALTIDDQPEKRTPGTSAEKIGSISGFDWQPMPTESRPF